MPRCQTAGISLADSRDCEQCGTSFVPRREHARFCSVHCRAAWNREHMGDPQADASALLWSVTAMTEATARLPRTATWDRARVYAVVGEAVWWVTLVDATMVRHHPEPYDNVMAGQSPAQRQQIEATLAGLRFVRNRIGDDADLAKFIRAAAPGKEPGNRHRHWRRSSLGRRRGSGPDTRPTSHSWRATPSARSSVGLRHFSP
jgi:hypothetical protein